MNSATKTQVVKFIRKGEKGDTGAQGPQGDTGPKGDTGETGATGSRGPTMRGPQKWDSVDVGYSFQCGAEGESYKDVVVYNDNYYYCKSSHTKTASNYPGSTAGDSLWQLGDKVGLIATDLLIAKDEVVDNLNANYIEMKDSAGAIIFCAKDGEVTCNKGTFKDIVVDNGSKLGGLYVKDNELTNEDHRGEALIALYNNETSVTAAIGTNVSTLTGQYCPGRLSANVAAHSASETVKNIALWLEAMYGIENEAIHIAGGCISGLAVKTAKVTTSTTLAKTVVSVVCFNTTEVSVTLPTMSYYDDGHVIKLKNVNGYKVKILPGMMIPASWQSANQSRTYILSGRAVARTYSDPATLDSAGDAVELIYHRDMEKTVDGTTYKGCWVEYKHPRDW